MDTHAALMKTQFQAMVLMVANLTATKENRHGELITACVPAIKKFRRDGNFGHILTAIDETLGDDWGERIQDEPTKTGDRFRAVLAKLREEVKANAEEHGDQTDPVPDSEG